MLLVFYSWGIGGIAVCLFFVISGFLIGYRHFDKDEHTHKSLFQSCIVYVKSKYKKFYLLYMIMLIIGIPITFFGVIHGSETLFDFLIRLVVHSTLLQSLVPNSHFVLSFNWPSWYLSTSVVIYFFVPIILKFVKWLFKKHYVWSFLIITTVLNLLIVIIISPQAEAYDMWYYLLYLSPYIRIIHFTQAFCIGAYLKRQKGCEKHSYLSATVREFLVVTLFVVLIFLFTYTTLPSSLLAYSYIIPVPLSILMVYILARQEGWVSKVLANRFILWVSAVSFEFYMIHRMVLVYADYANRYTLNLNGYLVAFICCIITLVLSFAYKRFYDTRIVKA